MDDNLGTVTAVLEARGAEGDPPGRGGASEKVNKKTKKPRKDGHKEKGKEGGKGTGDKVRSSMKEETERLKEEIIRQKMKAKMEKKLLKEVERLRRQDIANQRQRGESGATITNVQVDQAEGSSSWSTPVASGQKRKGRAPGSRNGSTADRQEGVRCKAKKRHKEGPAQVREDDASGHVDHGEQHNFPPSQTGAVEADRGASPSHPSMNATSVEKKQEQGSIATGHSKESSASRSRPPAVGDSTAKKGGGGSTREDKREKNVSSGQSKKAKAKPRGIADVASRSAGARLAATASSSASPTTASTSTSTSTSPAKKKPRLSAPKRSVPPVLTAASVAHAEGGTARAEAAGHAAIATPSTAGGVRHRSRPRSEPPSGGELGGGDGASGARKKIRPSSDVRINASSPSFSSPSAAAATAAASFIVSGHCDRQNEDQGEDDDRGGGGERSGARVGIGRQSGEGDTTSASSSRGGRDSTGSGRRVSSRAAAALATAALSEVSISRDRHAQREPNCSGRTSATSVCGTFSLFRSH